MRLEQFYHFDAAAKSGSIRRASEEIYTTPQNISKSILQLEEELNVKLLNRSNCGIKLTENGEQAYQLIRQIIEDIEILKKEFNLAATNEIASKKPVTIASCPAQEPYVNAAVNLLYSDYPKTTIITNQLPRMEISNIIHSKNIEQLPDIVFTNIDTDSFSQLEKEIGKYYLCYFTYRDELRLQVPKNSEYADRDFISFSELAELPLLICSNNVLVPSEIELYLRDQGHPLKHFSKTNNINTCSQIAYTHNQFCFVAYPSVEIRPLANVNYIPLEKPSYRYQIILFKKIKRNREYVNSFLEIMDQYFDLKLLF